MRSHSAIKSPHTRLNCRVSASIKLRAEEAARVLGQSVTAFTETALAEKAESVLARLGAIQLTERDFQHFLKAIEGSRRPTTKLRKAASEYRNLRAANPKTNW